MNIVSMDDLADIVESSADVVGVLCPRAKEACEQSTQVRIYVQYAHAIWFHCSKSSRQNILRFFIQFQIFIDVHCVFSIFAHITVDLWIRPCFTWEMFKNMGTIEIHWFPANLLYFQVQKTDHTKVNLGDTPWGFFPKKFTNIFHDVIGFQIGCQWMSSSLI